MTITRSDIAKWTDAEAVIGSFEKLGFNKNVNKNGVSHIQLTKKPPYSYLKIIRGVGGRQVNPGDFASHANYILLLNGEDITFAKPDISASGNITSRKFRFSTSAIQNSALMKLRALKFDRHESFNDLFDKKEVVKRFYEQYKKQTDLMADAVSGVPQGNRNHYAGLLFYRLMFLYFIQTRGFLADDSDFLMTNFRRIQSAGGSFYEDFLKRLFFDVLNTRPADRAGDVPAQMRDIPFLNGGLFREHLMELTNPHISVKNEAFEGALCFLSSWVWYVDETADLGDSNGINPEILGHIFEKTITDQKGRGAYYTPVDVTKYMTENTIIPYCLERVNAICGTGYKKMRDIMENPDHAERFYFDVLRDITVLDNACGSGEFVLSASKMLFELYDMSWNAIMHSGSERVVAETKAIGEQQPAYYFKKRIITSNLFGVDIEEGAIEICKLRMWLSLVSEMSRDKAIPLPNIDFNIMLGNSILGYTEMPAVEQMRIDDVYASSTAKRISEIDKLKSRFRSEEDPRMTKTIKSDLDEKIQEYNQKFNSARMAEIGSGRRAKSLDKFNPFHWRLHFGHLFEQIGGGGST